MRVLFLSPRQCRPAVTGADLRADHLLRALRERAEVLHIFFSQPAKGAFVGGAPGKDVPVPPPRRYTPWKIARGVIGRWPLPILNYTTPKMKAAVAAAIQGREFDLAHLDSIHMAPYAATLSARTPIVYNWHNIESELMRRYAAIVGKKWKALYATITAGRLEGVERQILERAFGHIVCSERERAELLRLAPGARVAVIENGVDTEYFRPEDAPTARRGRVLFVGSMGYHANADAALWFAREAWPLVRAEFPDWVLTIVGSSPGPAVLALAENKNVEVRGTVPDLRPFYREAVAAIAPLRVAGGTRLKILEAMAAGTPVISTSMGAEGLEARPGSDILIAETAGDWLARLRELAGDAALRRRITQAGLELTRSRYDWKPIGHALRELYRKWLEEAGAVRR